MQEPHRRRPIRTVIVLFVVVALVGAGGWVLTGPPSGPNPIWARWTLPEDISAMQLSPSARYGLVGGSDESTVLNLTNGESSQYGEGAGPSQDGESFITDAGISGTITDTAITGYGPDGGRLWHRELADWDEPRLVSTSERTAVVDDDCSRGRQRVIGVDLQTGKLRWQETLADCDEHVYQMRSRSLVSMPGKRDGQRILSTIDDHRAVATVSGIDWAVRGDLLLTIKDGQMMATGPAQQRQRWTRAVCPESTGYRTVDHSEEPIDETEAPVLVTCGDRSRRIVDPRNGHSAELPDRFDLTAKVQQVPDTLIGVQTSGDRVTGTDLLTGRRLWQRPAPAGHLSVRTTPRSAVLTTNNHSHNTFTVVDLKTGEEQAHAPVWGDWWAGSAGSQGVWVTHRSLCTAPYDCTLHSTYLFR